MAFATWILIAINVAVFVVMGARGVSLENPTPSALVAWGANYGPLVTRGQWWRLLTSMFVHIGVLHLLMNMLVLWSVGPFTERYFGTRNSSPCTK
jgi:membrane associated rhomboid family serine protease